MKPFRKISPSFSFLFYTLLYIMGSVISPCYAQKAQYRVVPLPQSIEETNAEPFRLSATTSIQCDINDVTMRRNADFLSEYVEKATGWKLSLNEAKKRLKQNVITLRLNPFIKEVEGYRISVNKKSILIEGQTPNGVFYGIQMLRKSLPIISKSESVLFPAVVINDAPRFPYRGMHLDTSRHFFPVDFVKEYIDMLALHNMNKFHWHLTDDQGWRIEIKKYPLLTSVGSIRKTTVIGHNLGFYDGVPHTGFYTQEQARDIVEYARQRYITVIPEIDMPGHMLGALAAYPELGCTGGPYEVCGVWGVLDDILCAGNPKTLQFCKDVLDEIIQIFPSELIHIGGDEAPRVRWKNCSKCQQLIQSRGLKGDGKYSAEAKLQGYFTEEIEKFVNSKGRRIIGWDEVLEGDVTASTTIMSWRGMEGGIYASERGHDVIMAPTSHCYFDYYQADFKTGGEPFLIGGFLPIEKTYSLEPLPANMSKEAQKHILGVQANLWTEYIAFPSLVEYQVLPRMGALSECQWMQPEQKNFEDFKQRASHLTQIYRLYGWTYAKHLFK